MTFDVLLDEEWATPVLRRLPPATKKRVKAGLRFLRDDPFETNPKADILRLDTDPEREPVYRLRVGDWRIVFTRDARFVKVVRIMHREEGYEWLG